MTTFSVVVGLAIETTLGGLTVSQSLMSRAGAVPLNALTSTPYSSFRAFVSARLAKATRGSEWIGVVSDSISFVAFQVPLYLVVVTAAGVSFGTAVRSAVFIAIVSMVSGRPYGKYLDWMRAKVAARQ
jgi:hypothetical protein